MKILVLSNVPPGAVGGAEVQALQLAHRWVSRGHSVTVAGYTNEEQRDGLLEIVRIPTVRNSRIMRGSSYLISTLWLLWRRRQEFDVIYCRFLKEQAFSACLARTLFRMRQPIVACPAMSGTRGDIYALQKGRWRFFWLGLFDRQLSCINVISKRIESEVRSLNISGPVISSIPNGVVVPEGRKETTGKNSALRILFVGRLVHQKGVDILLDSCARIKAMGHDFTLEIVGDGVLRTHLEDAVESGGLKSQVTFCGKLRPDEIPERLQNADLFVLPSRDEGLPGALLEAFACGLPAVVTSVSGSEDIVDKKTGWLVPPGDAQALADALSEACVTGRNSLKDMGVTAREKVQSRYEIDLVAERYERLFRKLIDGIRIH